LLSLLVGLLTTAVWSARAEQRALAEKMIRLHVLANSDSEDDQRVKEQVRLAVCALLEEEMAGAEDAAQAGEILSGKLREIGSCAEKVLRTEGFDETVSVTLSRERYPLRRYGTFRLPAGEYRSLRIVLGEGAGQNWWCVVFPALCSQVTTASFESCAEAGGLSEEEVATITAGSGSYAVRFRILDLVGSLFP